MNWEMRRSKQVLTREEMDEVLKRGTSGVLAVDGDDDYPYAVPISYAYEGKKIIFHSARNGHKIDAIKRNPKVSFCVIDQDLVVPEEFTTYFRSVIVFGKAHIIEDLELKRTALDILTERYYPGHLEERNKEIEKSFDNLVMVEIDIENISGKEAIELVRSKRNQ